MPKLTALLLCEKVIIDLKSHTPSVISIFQNMNVPLPDAPLPDKAVSPIRWAIFSIWQHDESERGREYVQHTQIIDPTGTLFAETTATFKITEPDDIQSRNIVEIFGLPVSNEGTATVRVWIEGIAESAADLPFQIKHVRSQPNEQTGADKQESVS